MNIHEIMNKKDGNGNFILSPLPYTDDHLEPYIGERTVRYHYYRHLQAYINNVNMLKRPSDTSIEDILRDKEIYDSPLYRNASQVFNHYFYFEQFKPKKVKDEPMPPLSKLEWAIEHHGYGDFGMLQKEITSVAMNVFGSGWVFLTTDKYKSTLWVRSYVGTGTPIIETPVLALDVWEHAYYLDYQNDRKKYIENFFEAIDWEVIEKRLDNFAA